MPEVAPSIPGFTQFEPPPQTPAAPTLGETFGAAFDLGNDVSNAIELARRPAFEPDQNFNLLNTLQTSKYWDSPYRNDFAGTKSKAEFDYRSAQIQQELHQREVLSRSGWAGTVAMLTAGLASPTVFIPMLGEARGLKGIGQAAALGLSATAAQEIPLASRQYTRTPEDTAVNLAAGTILGGMFGAAAHFISPGERAALETAMDTEGGMVPKRYEQAIPDPTGPSSFEPRAAGAASAIPESAGGLAPGVGWLRKALDSTPALRNPVTDSIASFYNAARWTAAQLSDSGMKMAKNIMGVPTTPGGTVEARVNAYYGDAAQTIQHLDDQYTKYYYDNKVPFLFPQTRAYYGGMMPESVSGAAGKMSKQDFNREVTLAGWSGDVHPNPYVQSVAKVVREKIYLPIQEAMQKVGLLTEELKQFKDPSYIQHLWDQNAIRANPVKFVDLIAGHFEAKLDAEFAKSLEKLNGKANLEKELISDIQRPRGEVEDLVKKFREEIQTLEESKPAPEQWMEDDVAGLRAMARQRKAYGGVNDMEAARKMLADARDMERAFSPAQKETKARRAELKRRLKNLSGSQSVLEGKKMDLLTRADKIEERSSDQLQTLVRVGRRILDKMDDWSDKELNAQLEKWRNLFEDTAQLYDKGEERIVKLLEETKEGDMARLLAADVLQQKRSARMSGYAEKVADVEDLGRPALRSLIQDELNAAVERTADLNARRAIKADRLRERAAGVEPSSVNARINSIIQKGKERQQEFEAFWREKRGAEDLQVDPNAQGTLSGSANFTPYARKIGEEIKDKITGSYLRLPAVDIMQGERGSELARALDISGQDAQEFLETDIEKLILSHIRTLAPDIEIMGKLGSVNGEKQFTQLVEEQNQLLRNIETAVDKNGNPRGEKWKVRERALVQDEFLRVKRNLEGIIGRLRHTWGVPSDPNGVGARMGRMLSHINTLRYMGGVTISSIPDIGRPIMRYGILHTFKEGFIPLISNFKTLRLSMREVRYAGAAVDVDLNHRFHAMMDIMENGSRTSKLERGVDYLTSRQGTIAGFNYWTDWMKMFSGSLTNAKLMDGIARAVEGKADKKTIEFLAENGIGGKEAAQIWEVASRNGGAEKRNGIWLPNTENWTGRGADEARRAYRAALSREVNNMIITPGVERPLWTNETQTAKLLTQFKSFTLSSTSKMLMAGLQQHDMAAASGMVISLAMGALSYYIYATLAGGDVKKKMESASFAHWADEAISRSGMTAAFGIGQDLFSRIPVTAPYASFSGGYTERRGGDDLLATALGPSFDFAKNAAQVLAQINKPKDSTYHAARKLMPYQNLTGLRTLLDKIDPGARQ
jgi:hypothetical protein